MKNAIERKHADRVVLVSSDDYGLATGRRLMAEGASVFAVGPFGELRSVGPVRSRKIGGERKRFWCTGGTRKQAIRRL